MTKHQDGWSEFIELCKEMKGENKLSTLLDLLLTPQEKESIAMRCLIIRELLREEQTQRDIAKNLNVSIAKITRGSNELKRISRQFLQYLKSKLV
jgi:TrpR family trp operon transcriptional repressor